VSTENVLGLKAAVITVNKVHTLWDVDYSFSIQSISSFTLSLAMQVRPGRRLHAEQLGADRQTLQLGSSRGGYADPYR
jgi:glutaminase